MEGLEESVGHLFGTLMSTAQSTLPLLLQMDTAPSSDNVRSSVTCETEGVKATLAMPGESELLGA